MNHDPLAYVHHILESMSHVESWVAEGREQFDRDIRTRQAVVRTLHEITESVNRLEPLLGERYPEVPWREVRGFRNVVVHDYLGLKLARVWEIATLYLPVLRPHIERMLAELEPPQP